MKKTFHLSTLVIIMTASVYGQGPDSKQRNYHPVSPSVFQFLKYDEMPVSEYTGIPNISVPLYQIEVDGVNIPINLTYHAGGIRVNQEASWVGLGWDLNASGSIVQEINDVDDYSPYTNIVRLRPDYKWNPYPTFFPTKYTYPNCLNIPGNGWSNPYPIEPLTNNYSYMMTTANWIPINGDFNNQQLGEQILSFQEYDSEPDIFTANFLGHSIKFMRDISGGNIIVLNKKGYKVIRTGDNFNIITPSGDQFYFETKSQILGNIENLGGILQTNVENYDPSSKIWMLTKIITKNKKQILFNYSQSGTVNNYPGYSEKVDIFTSPVINTHNLNTSRNQENVQGYYELLWGHPLTTISKSYYHSTETRFFLSSIVFPNGQVNFTTSDRNDFLGGKSLDAFQVYTDHIIKSYQFNYSYFDAASVGGNTSSPPFNASIFGNMPNLRLKLNSIQDNNGAVHNFGYNTNPLPSKNSLAQDFWGYYNGQLSNTSITPNPARLNIPGLADNGNNNSANFNYTQSAILTEIQYPTGGKNTFEYELNQFDNYWVPDFSTTTNLISSGNGLRIHAVNFLSSNNQISKKTIYSYSGGKAINPLQIFRDFPATDIRFVNPQNITSISYSVYELNGQGFFSSNSLGSINGVGYDKVIKTDIDINGITNGRTETLFNNTPDKYYSSAALPAQFGATLPTRKGPNNPENGTTQKIMIYTKDNVLVKKIENTYTTTSGSGLYYGARIFGYPALYYPADNCVGSSIPYWSSLPQYVIGYYPIYDFESIPQQTTTTDYDNNNNSIVTNKFYSYDYFGQLSSEAVNKSLVPNQNGQIIQRYSHPYDNYPSSPSSVALLQQNRFAEVTNERKTLVTGPAGYYPAFLDYDKVDHEYITIGDKVVKSMTIVNSRPGSNEQPYVITYNLYDPANANLLEYTSKGLINSMLWDYNGEYLTAEVTNANFQNIAATSFEADSKGNWTYAGNPVADASSPTGAKAYLLSNGSISKISLNVSKTYIVSYWSKNGQQTISGSSTASSGRTLNGYTYYEHKVVNPAGGSITISGTGTIDELRLYPDKTFMATYTYKPLIGMSSQCDANNRISYYEYDASNRLVLIRDQDKNILKKICYNYAGQPENCLSPCTNYTPNWQNTATPPTCEQGTCGNTGYQLQEQQDMNPCNNGATRIERIYNATACPLPTGVTNITSQNNVNTTGFTAVYTSRTTGQVYTFPIQASGTGIIGCLPADSYTLTISKPGNMMLILFGTGCWTQSGTSAYFGKVSVPACSMVTLQYDLE